jgi:hypothetical protein
LGESYSGIRALADYIRDVTKYQQPTAGALGRGFGEFISEFDGRIKQSQQCAWRHNSHFQFIGMHG